MFSHLIGVIGCCLCLGVTSISAYNKIDDLNNSYYDSNSSAYPVANIHEYQTISYLYGTNDYDNTYRLYYKYDLNTQTFTFDSMLEYLYPSDFDTPSSSTDYDTITSNYIKLNSLITSFNELASTNDDGVVFYFVCTQNYIYRICKYNPNYFANLGYLEYNANNNNFSLLSDDDYSGFIANKLINYSYFYNIGSQNGFQYSYFDYQPYGCCSRLFYYSAYHSIHYSNSGTLDLRVDFDLYSLPNNYQNGYRAGYNDGLNDGYNSGFDDGQTVGYQKGYDDGSTQGSLEINFLAMLGAIADTPVRIITNLYSFDLFGVSALTIFMSILTAIIVIHFVRKFI